MPLKIRYHVIFVFTLFSVLCFFVMRYFTKSIIAHSVISKSVIVKIILTFLFGYFGIVSHVIVMTLLSVIGYLVSKKLCKEEIAKGFAITSIICVAACLYITIAALM